MELTSKPGFERTLERFEAWWRRELVDRAPVNIHVPAKRQVEKPISRHANERERWLDLEFRLAEMEAAVANRLWVADSFPSFIGNLGPEILATLYGAELEFTRDSSWSRPICHSSRQVLDLQPDLTTKYWTWLRQWLKASLERGRGKWITGITDLHTHADLLAALREPQELLLELMDDRDAVREAIRHLTPLFEVVYDDQAKPIIAAGQPTMSWAPEPHRGRGCVLQADFICMVSPEMFEDIFLPALKYEMERLDRSIFHLDGPNALQHLDALLACPRLDAVQWVYGAGNGPGTKWIDVYKRIQSAGKSMEIACTDIADALAIAEHLKPGGCFFNVGGTYTEEEVNRFLDRMERWSAGKGV